MNIRQKISVDLEDHKASDSDLDLKYHKTSDSDSDLKYHKVSDLHSNISKSLNFCYLVYSIGILKIIIIIIYD